MIIYIVQIQNGYSRFFLGGGSFGGQSLGSFTAGILRLEESGQVSYTLRLWNAGPGDICTDVLWVPCIVKRHNRDCIISLLSMEFI